MKLYIKSLIFATMAMGAITTLPSCSEADIAVIDPNAVPEASQYADNVEISVDQDTNTATFRFTGSGVMPAWYIDGKLVSSTFEFTKYYRKAGTYKVELKVGNANGYSFGSVEKEFTVNKTKMTGFAGYQFDSEFNLYKKSANRSVSFYYAPGWQAINPVDHSLTEDALTINMPVATTDKWQAQAHLKTDISLKEGESYDGSVIITSTTDLNNITVKIHPDGDDDDGHSFFPQQKVSVKAGEPQAFWFSELPAVVDMNNVVFTFDFGGNPENTQVTVENIVIKNHKDDDGTVVPAPEPKPTGNWVDVASADNIWSGATVEEMFFYYAPGWAQIANPEVEFTGKDAIVTLPSATFEQWQAQMAFRTNIGIADTETSYDFMCVLKSNNALPGVTVKLTQTGDDNNFFFAEKVALKANEPVVFSMLNMKAPKPMEKVSLFFDFGGNPADTKVEISKIILQKHHD